MVIQEAIGEDGEPVDVRVVHRLKHAVPSENAFKLTCAKAISKGMKVNTLKTNLLCVGDALSYKQVAYIEDSEGTRITSEPGGSIKVLGFHFVSRPTMAKHVASIKKKLRQRIWTIYNLKKKRFSQDELVLSLIHI